MTEIEQHKLKFLPWLVWGVAAFYVLYQFLLQSSISVMIVNIEQSFHINAIHVSVLSSSFFYTYLLLQIPAGILTDHFGPRKVLLIGIAVCVIACLLFAVTSHDAVAELSRLLMGAVTAPAVVCAMTLAVYWFPAEYFALLVGLTEMLGMLGGAVGEVILAHLVNSPLGWRGTIIIAAVVGVALLLLVWLLVYDKPEHRLARKSKIKPIKVSNFSFAAVSAVLTIPRIWIVGLCGGLMFSLLAAFASFWSIPYLMHDYNFSLHFAALASAMVFLGATVGTPFFGWFSDVIKCRCLLMQISCVIAGLMICGFLYIPKLAIVWLFLLLFLSGFFSSGYVLAFAVTSDIVSTKLKATALGFTNMLCILLGAPIFQPLIGELLVWTHNSYQMSLSVLPISFLVAFLLLFFVKETYGS